MRKVMMPALALATGLLAGCCGWFCGSCETKTTGLTTDQLVSPANIGETPSFSWRMCSEREGAAQTAYRIMGKPYKAVLGGGVFIHVPEYAEAVAARAPEGCELQVLDTPTLYGAALEAMWLCGEDVPAGFKTRFIETYNSQPNLHSGW